MKLFRTRIEKQQQPLELIHCVPDSSHYENKLGLYDIGHKHKIGRDQFNNVIFTKLVYF